MLKIFFNFGSGAGVSRRGTGTARHGRSLEGGPLSAPPSTSAAPSTKAAGEVYLEVKNLKVSFATEDGVVKAVDDVSFSVPRGRTLGIVGESGSGKSVTSLAVLGLHDRRRASISGQILVGGRDIVAMGDEQVRDLRGRDMAMIFQDPLSALHPYYTVGRQIAEAYRVHN